MFTTGNHTTPHGKPFIPVPPAQHLSLPMRARPSQLWFLILTADLYQYSLSRPLGSYCYCFVVCISFFFLSVFVCHKSQVQIFFQERLLLHQILGSVITILKTFLILSCETEVRQTPRCSNFTLGYIPYRNTCI